MFPIFFNFFDKVVGYFEFIAHTFQHHFTTMTKRRNKKNTEKPKAKELKALRKKVEEEIVDNTLGKLSPSFAQPYLHCSKQYRNLISDFAAVSISHATGKKRPHSNSDIESDVRNKIPKHITPSTPYQPSGTPVDPDALGNIFYQPSARTLQARIAAFVPNCTPAKSFSDLFNYLFLSSPYPNYESICFCYDEANCGTELEDFCPRHEACLEELGCSGRYYDLMEIHIATFSYILKRISCLPLIEAEKYLIKEDGASATDKAFIYFLRALLSASGLVKEAALIETAQTEETPAQDPQAQPTQAQATQTQDTPLQVAELQAPLISETQTTSNSSSPSNIETSSTNGNSLIISDQRAIKAFKIFTQHPLRFKVQTNIGQELLKEERCMVWCTDVRPKGEGGGGWEVQWEYMSKWTEYGVNDEINYSF
jgi:hypothetical protein